MKVKVLAKNSKGQVEELKFRIIRSLSGNLVDINIGVVPLRELNDWMATFGYSIIRVDLINEK